MAFAAPSYSLVDLFGRIHHGELQLPDFQRSFSWDVDRIRSLIATTLRGYPVGALLAPRHAWRAHAVQTPADRRRTRRRRRAGFVASRRPTARHQPVPLLPLGRPRRYRRHPHQKADLPLLHRCARRRLRGPNAWRGRVLRRSGGPHTVALRAVVKQALDRSGSLGGVCSPLTRDRARRHWLDPCAGQRGGPRDGRLRAAHRSLRHRGPRLFTYRRLVARPRPTLAPRRASRHRPHRSSPRSPC